MPERRKWATGMKLLAAFVLVSLLIMGVYMKVQRITSIHTYNAADADLVRKVEMAVGKDVPPPEMEQFVGAEATLNTWRTEDEYGLGRINVVGDPPSSSSPIKLRSAKNVMAWPRPVHHVDNYPRMVGVMWDQNGKAT